MTPFWRCQRSNALLLQQTLHCPVGGDGRIEVSRCRDCDAYPIVDEANATAVDTERTSRLVIMSRSNTYGPIPRRSSSTTMAHCHYCLAAATIPLRSGRGEAAISCKPTFLLPQDRPPARRGARKILRDPCQKLQARLVWLDAQNERSGHRHQQSGRVTQESDS